MLIYLQTIEQYREAFPFLPLTLIGVGILAMLWLIRHGNTKKKSKPASLARLEDRHSTAIRQIGSIRMNQWMDKRINALVIPRIIYPIRAETHTSLKQVTEFQKQATTRAKARTDKTPRKGVS